MKTIKFVLALLCLLGGAGSVSASVVDLYWGYNDPYPTIPDYGKSPVTVPEVWLDDHEVTFQSGHPQYMAN